MKYITKTEVIFVKFIPLGFTTLKLTSMLQHVYLNKIVVVVVVAAAAVIVIIVVVLVVEEVVHVVVVVVVPC
jgi:hypothetical protein